MENITEEFLQAIPKNDLHVHLGGSVDLDLMIETSKLESVTLPAYTPDLLRKYLFKPRYKDLNEYLECFKYTSAVTQSYESLFKTAYTLGMSAFKEGVRYIEVRFAPHLHVSETNPDPYKAIQQVYMGLKTASETFNLTNDDNDLPYKFGIICIALRMFTEHSSYYYKNFMECHKYATKKSIYSMAALETARLAVFARNQGLPIVGFDLAGAENGYPGENYKDAFDYAHKQFLKKTVHAGEAFGPESIFQAITELHADRIGHGTHLLDPEAIQDPKIKNRELYVQMLSQYIADRRILIETCLTSNMMVKPEMESITQHPFSKFLENGISLSICTDNRTVCNTSSTNELKLAVEHFNLSPSELKQIVIAGFKKSFFPGNYLEKRNYVHKAIEVYESVELEYLGYKSPRL